MSKNLTFTKKEIDMLDTYLDICEKCDYYFQGECRAHMERKNIENMRNNTAYFFRFWLNCGKNGRFFRGVYEI